MKRLLSTLLTPLTIVCLASTELLAEVTIIEMPKSERSEVNKKVFYSKVSESDAKAKCEEWLKTQKDLLGRQLKLAHCEDGQINTNPAEGLAYVARGEITYRLAADPDSEVKVKQAP